MIGSLKNVKVVLDNVMKERTALNIGTVKKQADLITFEQENLLLKESLLGEDTPDKLRETSAVPARRSLGTACW